MTVLAPPHPTASATAAGGTVRRVAAAFGLALASTLGVVAVYALFVRTAVGQRVDELAMQGAQVEHARVVRVLDSTLDGTSLLSVGLVALAAAGIGLLRRRADLAVAAGVFVLGSNVTTQLLKALLTRPLLDAPPAPNSLPSGHTTAAAAVAFALVMVLPHAARAVVTLLGAGYVAVIAVATVWAGWHRPSDVIAALLVVLAWGAAAMGVVRAVRRLLAGPGGDETDRPPSRLATTPLAVAGTAGGTLAVLALGAVAVSVLAWPALNSGTLAFLAGSAGMCGTAAAVFLIWLRLVSGPPGRVAAAPGRPGVGPLRRVGPAGRAGAAED